MNSTNNPVVAAPTLADFPNAFKDSGVEGVVTFPSGGASNSASENAGLNPNQDGHFAFSEMPLFVKQ